VHHVLSTTWDWLSPVLCHVCHAVAQASVADHLPVVTPFHELAIQQHLTMLLNTDSKLNEAVGAQQEKYKVEMDNLKVPHMP
jgi:2-phospho-L-lactate guanylyltransferase (CobY/MobA/RfbA family)